MPVPKPGEDRRLTRGQYNALFRSFINAKNKRRLEHGEDFRDILYQGSDYFDNVSQGEYDHKKYLDYLIKNKDLHKNILGIMPRIEY